MVSIKLGLIVEDFDLYPRDNVSSKHVSDLQLAIESGSELPPIVIDKKSKRIVDGFHRRRAMQKAYGPDHEVEVVAKTYKSESDLFIDACRYNASHGLRLDTHDKTTALIKGERLGIDRSSLAEALVMKTDKAASLKTSRTAKNERGDLVPIKNTIKHYAGRRLNTRQSEANKKLSGMNQVFYVNQLIELLESKLIDLDDDKLVERLKVLRAILGEMFK